LLPRTYITNNASTEAIVASYWLPSGHDPGFAESLAVDDVMVEQSSAVVSKPVHACSFEVVVCTRKAVQTSNDDTYLLSDFIMQQVTVFCRDDASGYRRGQKKRSRVTYTAPIQLFDDGM
jgi:hypothetical protein